MEYEGLVRYTETTINGIHGIHFQTQGDGAFSVK